MATIDIECQTCKGTGVYVGLGERDGAAVVCVRCKGSGCVSFSYEPFAKRRRRDNVTRVYKEGYGYCIAPHKIDFDKIGEVDLSEKGVSYKEFLQGRMPEHIREMGCPMRCDQGACRKLKGFTDKCHELGLGWGNITDCKNYCDRDQCWKRFDSAEPK